ncbi:MAG: sugar transferase [Rhizomicrobium sp.]
MTAHARQVQGWTSSRIYTADSGSTTTFAALALVASDIGAIAASLSLVVLAAGRGNQILNAALFGGAICDIIGLYLFGLYPGRGMFGPQRVRLRALMALLAFAAPAATLALGFSGGVPAVLVCTAGGVLVFLFGSFFEVVTIHVLDRFALWRSDALIAGEPGDLARVRSDLELFPELGFRPVDDTSQTVNKTAARLQLAGRRQPGQVSEYLVDSLSPLPAVYPLTQATTSYAAGNTNFLPRLVKRSMDILGALTLAVLAGPLLLALPLLIVSFDGLPIFFRQNRRGKDGQPIMMWKFRSMYKDAELRLDEVLAADSDVRLEWERHFKMRNDPRVLPVVGPPIRKSSVDELPQIWNILKGEMSLVGPRPFPENHLAAFSPEFQAFRQTTTPGLTGLWQVTVRSDGRPRDAGAP